MSQSNNVPDHIMRFFLECGLERNMINYYWVQSGFNEDKMQDLIQYGIQNPDQNIPEKRVEDEQIAFDDFDGGSILNDHVIKVMEKLIKKTPRNSDSFVGIENVENDNVVNIMLQLIHQVPQIYDQVFKIKYNNQHVLGQFLRELQLLLTELTASNSSFISSRKLLTSSFWNQQELKFLECQQDPEMMFHFFIYKIDNCFREFNRQQEQRNNQIFNIQEFNSIFQMKITNNQIQENLYMLETNMQQNSVYSFLYEQYRQKFLQLPQILFIKVNRDGQSQNKKFELNQVLEIEFLKVEFQEPIPKDQFNYQSLVEDLENLQKNLSIINKAIKMYQDEVNQEKNIIAILKSKKNTLEQKITQKQDALRNEKLAYDSQSCQNNNKYVIHSVALRKGYSGNKTSILYVQNFKTKQWLKFLNNQCQVMFDDEEVLSDSNKYGLFATYVSVNLVPQFKQHINNLTDIGNKISRNLNFDINQIQSLKSLIPEDVLRQTFKSNLENYRTFNQ